MSKLNIIPDIFLETQELNRLVKFLEDDGWKRAVKSIVKSYGIVQNANNDNYAVSILSSTSGTVSINPGLAFNSNLEGIVLENSVNMQIPNTGIKQWIVIEYQSTNTEKGWVNIGADGTLSQRSPQRPTLFTEVLRGQNNFPTKVRFPNSTVNTGEYQVVSVNSDTEAIIVGDLTAESINDNPYQVIGCFTPEAQLNDDQKLIYTLDTVSITIVESATAPPITSGLQFVIASVEWTDLGMTVYDERASFMFNSSDYAGIVRPQSDNLVSLLSLYKYGNNTLEFRIENCYNITDYNLTTGGNTTRLEITEGNSNFLGNTPTTISNNYFQNWLLVNRITAKYAIIESNTNNFLYLSGFTSAMLSPSGIDNDFIIVPNYSEIEYKIEARNQSSTIIQIPVVHRVSLGNGQNRLPVLLPTGTWVIDLSYRLIQSGTETTSFLPFAVAQYTDQNGNQLVLGNSQLITTI